MNYCEQCELEITCRIKIPLNWRGKPALGPTRCAYYTCPDGLEAARQALVQREPESIYIEEVIQAYPFGTAYKPTDELQAAIRRWVSPPPDGRIWASLPNGTITFTGQTIDSLTEHWESRGEE